MQLFSEDAMIFKKKIAYGNFKKVAHNRPKISPNLIFCSMKMALSATSI